MRRLAVFTRVSGGQERSSQSAGSLGGNVKDEAPDASLVRAGTDCDRSGRGAREDGSDPPGGARSRGGAVPGAKASATDPHRSSTGVPGARA